MARQESDRENILREATALVDRLEVECDGWDEPVVCGFRRQGAMSLFIGQEEVYQFDSRQALRRGYWYGRLLKAERGRLIELTRQRSDRQTALLRRELTAVEEAQHLSRLQGRVATLRAMFHQGRYRQRGEVSGSGESVVARVRQWLDTFPAAATVAAAPHVE